MTKTTNILLLIIVGILLLSTLDLALDSNKAKAGIKQYLLRR